MKEVGPAILEEGCYYVNKNLYCSSFFQPPKIPKVMYQGLYILTVYWANGNNQTSHGLVYVGSKLILIFRDAKCHCDLSVRIRIYGGQVISGVCGLRSGSQWAYWVLEPILKMYITHARAFSKIIEIYMNPEKSTERLQTKLISEDAGEREGG